MARTRLPGPGGLTGPLATSERLPGRPSTLRDLVYRSHPRQRCDIMEGFELGRETYTLDVALAEATGLNTILVGANSRGYLTVPRGGIITAVSLTAEDTLAADNSNYITATLTNRTNVLGTGSTAVLAATDANTTKLTGGADITAKTRRSFTLSATTAALYVSEGDVLEFLAAVTGTLANAVTVPRVQVTIATLPRPFFPRIIRGAASNLPGVYVPGAVSNGEVLCAVSNGSNAQTAGFDCADLRSIVPSKGPIFQCRAKVSALAASQRVVLGLASDFTATLDSITYNAWFRLDGGLAVTIEGDDNSTDTDDKATSVTLTADTYYWFTINMADLTQISFWVDEQEVGIVSAALATNLLQPACYLQKGAVAGTPTLTVDEVRVTWNKV